MHQVLVWELIKVLFVSSIDWYRVVLNEAYTIKSSRTQGAQAAFALSSYCQWCLFGTPPQNNLEDLYLLCFLQVEPWCNWAWWHKLIQWPYKNGDPHLNINLQMEVKVINLEKGGGGDFDCGRIHYLILREFRRIDDRLRIYTSRKDILRNIHTQHVMVLIGETGLVQFLSDSGVAGSNFIVCTQPSPQICPSTLPLR